MHAILTFWNVKILYVSCNRGESIFDVQPSPLPVLSAFSFFKILDDSLELILLVQQQGVLEFIGFL